MEIRCKKCNVSNEFIFSDKNKDYVNLGSVGAFTCHKCKQGHTIIKEPNGSIKILKTGEEE